MLPRTHPVWTHMYSLTSTLCHVHVHLPGPQSSYIIGVRWQAIHKDLGAPQVIRFLIRLSWKRSTV